MYLKRPYMEDMGYKFFAFKGIRLLRIFLERGNVTHHYFAIQNSTSTSTTLGAVGI